MKHHRKGTLKNRVVGISISGGTDLLALGYGEEHLQEILMRIGRPLLRHSADLAYGGHIKHESFTRDLIELIASDQQDDLDGAPLIGKLYNHVAWPYYRDLTAVDEATWIDCCVFVRITQEMAELAEDERIAFPQPGVSSPRIAFNKSVALSAMRRIMTDGIPQRGIPRISARIVIAGKTEGFTGIMPGIFEETWCALKSREETPIFILGGFGGAAGKIKDFLSQSGGGLAREFTQEHYRETCSDYALIEEGYREFRPDQQEEPARVLADFCARLRQCRKRMKACFRNGLNGPENRQLLETTDVSKAIELIMKGLGRCGWGPASATGG